MITAQRLLVAAGTLVATAAVTAAASAASVLSVSGDAIRLTDPVGEANWVSVNWGNNPSATPTITDHAGVVATPPCFDITSMSDFACPTPGRPSFVVELGDGDDVGQSINSMAAGTRTELRGGPGNDKLESGAGSDVLDGGLGDDELRPNGDKPSGGNVVRGGPGEDHLILAGVLAPRLSVTLDDRANDGIPGARDDYASDIENVTGSSYARNTIVGTDGPNVIVGGDQADRITGGGGRDDLSGRGGGDTIDALDGSGGDRVSCGEGADVVGADSGDVVAGDCERVTWAPAISSSSLRFRGKRIAVRLGCPRASRATCSGTVRLTSRSGKRIASSSYRVARGKATAVSFRVARKPARRATVLVAPRGTKPVAGRAVTVR